MQGPEAAPLVTRAAAAMSSIDVCANSHVAKSVVAL
jgi:hypothetical protein